MRFCGRRAPASGAGPFGHVAIAFSPARTVATNDEMSIFFRPGISSGAGPPSAALAVPGAGAATGAVASVDASDAEAGDAEAAAVEATSPLAVDVVALSPVRPLAATAVEVPC